LDALVKVDGAVAGIGEPDRLVVGMHHHVVGAIELLVAGLVRQHGDVAIVFEAHQPGAFGADLPAFGIKAVAIALVGWLAELGRDVAVIVEVAQLTIVGNVTPYQILAGGVPCRTLGPQAAGVEPLDRGVADLGLEALGVDDDDVGIGVALRLGAAAEITRERIGGGQRGRQCGGAAQQASAVKAVGLGEFGLNSRGRLERSRHRHPPGSGFFQLLPALNTVVGGAPVLSMLPRGKGAAQKNCDSGTGAAPAALEPQLLRLEGRGTPKCSACVILRSRVRLQLSLRAARDDTVWKLHRIPAENIRRAVELVERRLQCRHAVLGECPRGPAAVAVDRTQRA
jgi:hypothetical protein